MKEIFVIKIGGSVLLNKQQELDADHMAEIAGQIAMLQKAGLGVVLVISGAVATGSHVVDLSQRLGYKRQAAAGVGQVRVIADLQVIFSREKITIAQMLITKHEFLSTQQEIKRLLLYYVMNDVVPVINENDVMELNSFGGNDLLAAEVARLLHAKKLIMLSSMNRSAHATGGGATKYQAIAQLRDFNIEACIVDGREKNVL
ncbi:MAG TPA: hypothetical protein VLF20_03160, partial [Patescibacteria group bacterium]|nr:hypothetical protein [Patescibacteria group bacterium]